MKRMLGILLLLVLLTGTAAAEWTCAVCGYTWPDTEVYCNECGFDEPVHDLRITITGSNFLRLEWYGAGQPVNLYVASEGQDELLRIVGDVTGTAYVLRDLQPGTQYYIVLMCDDGSRLMLAHGRTIGTAPVETAADATPVSSGAAAASDPNTAAMPAEPTLTVGSQVSFGHYPQTWAGDDDTPITWRVLEVKGRQAMLISEYGLDAKPFHHTATDVSWATCSLRSWLNSEFLHRAFSETEQKAIAITRVANGGEQDFGGGQGSKAYFTFDRVYLLSCAEAVKYFSGNLTRRASATDYASRRGAWKSATVMVDARSTSVFWLRSPGNGPLYAAIIDGMGGVQDADGIQSGRRYDDASTSFRPVIWVNLDSGLF